MPKPPPPDPIDYTPYIEIKSPAPGTTFTGGSNPDTISVTGTVTMTCDDPGGACDSGTISYVDVQFGDAVPQRARLVPSRPHMGQSVSWSFAASPPPLATPYDMPIKATVTVSGRDQFTWTVEASVTVKIVSALVGIGEFQFSACSGAVKIQAFTFMKGALPVPDRSKIDFMTWEEKEGDGKDDDLYMLQADESSTEVLQQTPGVFHVLYPHQYDPFGSQDAWFFEDEQRTFFVQTSRSGKDWPPIWFNPNVFINPNQLYPGIIAAALARPYMIAPPPVIVKPIADQHNPAPAALAPISNAEATALASSPPVNTVISVNVLLAAASQFWLGSYYTYYTFTTFYHPYVCDFIRRLNRGGIDELLHWSPPESANPGGPVQFDANLTFFQPTYLPQAVDAPYPRELVDFTYGAPYADYNWELFFHAPLRIATRLSQNQRFAEAMKWFHYIFDPTSGYDDPSITDAQMQQRVRYWKVTKLRDEAQKSPTTLQQLLIQLGSDGELPGMVKNWKDHPFSPYLIARQRLVAFQRTVVMKYIDNLLAWGDQLFRQAVSLENINEATLLYIRAAEILGPKPQQIPPAVTPSDQMTYNQLVSQGLNASTNPLVALENILLPGQDGGQFQNGGLTRVAIGSGNALFFCIPANEKLLQYWDTVADRLFKIRHCQNIEGIEQQFPPFGPPIDPGLLVRAAAAGIDLSTALNDINAALPCYRFTTMLQKAIDLCADVRSLGGALLAALEKHDAEELALLRSSQEIQLLTAVRQVKQQQVDEANATLAGLERYRAMITARQTYYANLLQQGKLPSEQSHLDGLDQAWQLQATQAGIEFVAGILHLIPDTKLGALTTIGFTLGGGNIGAALQSFGSGLGLTAASISTKGTSSVTQAGYDRRTAEWNQQLDQATKELAQVQKQIDAATIRLQIAQNELDNHDLQIQNAQDVDDYLRNQKFTNVDLYDWMVGQVSAVYFQSYQFAFDIAKRAEQAYSYEIADPSASFIHFGYWDNLKQGLLAGEQLQQDLRRMEIAYLDQNRREFEITRHIPLSQLDPMALLILKQTGSCFVSLPETLFDGDYPGHYLRRIKTASLSIPCVAGPYTSVNCTLTLLWNSIRQKTDLPGGNYPRKDVGNTPDKRFRDNVGAIQSIVTSSGQTDSGMFDLNFHDERYLPFEGAGCISDWRIELPLDTNAFDFDTITDVIVHLRYTARDGGDTLKAAARQAQGLAPQPPAFARKEPPPAAPQARLFSCKHEFANDWYRFLHPNSTSPDQVLSLDLSQNLFPFQFRNRQISITAIHVFLELKEGVVYDDTQPLSFTLGYTDNSTQPPAMTSYPASFKIAGSPVITLPYAEPLQGRTGQVGAWDIEIKGSDITNPVLQQAVTVGGQTYVHLNPDVVEDTWIACSYSIS